ncbi:carbamoyltransferase [Pontimicrobium sp. IMCC45349]|uniref:carbamoyltransferase family protein n=1 Tax=Pontimicrobium sp. IMCC45349 TaxID=3391574 RepID=UPI0039A0CD6B
MSKILGISAFYHDSAAALIIDNKVIAAAQEERFNRVKHYSEFPSKAIKYCLKEGNLDLTDLDAIVFYDKPFLKFERLLDTYYAFAPKGLRSFLKAMPLWLHKKLFLKKTIRQELKALGFKDTKNIKLLFSEHHLSHAASAFYSSPYNHAAILTIDGVGEWATATIGIGENESVKVLKELQFPHSVGLLYSAFTYFLGFKVNSGEYKLMGLAPYGNPNDSQTLAFENLILEHLVKIYDDGSIWLNQDYFSYANTLRMVPDKKWEILFGFAKRTEGEQILQEHCNLAYAIQKITEEIVLKLAVEAKRITKSDNLCMAGGVVLNCVANGKLEAANIFKNIWIQPASGDAGGALGAAQVINHMYFKNKRLADAKPFNPYLGPRFSNFEVQQVNKKYKAVYKHLSQDELIELIAGELSKGKVIGWFQDSMEFGPRALGNRSILADPTFPETQKNLNLKIKKREAFRPFAPAVLLEDVSTYFASSSSSPYMLKVTTLNKSLQKNLPSNYFEQHLLDRLYVNRSKFQAITHVDFSARVQTVSKNDNKKFWKLLTKFKAITSYGVLANTSFNVRGEPIVCSPEDAYLCFMNTDMDYLVIQDYIYKKEAQIHWKESMNIPNEFQLD